MPSIIAFISQPGNVMKTTLAAATGLELVSAGLSTLAIDLDAEHRDRGASLSTWLSERAARHPDRVQLSCRAPDSAAEGLELISNASEDIVIVDCPSRATEATIYIAGAADFTIMPLAPGDKDTLLSHWTLQTLLDAGVAPERLAVIITRTGSASEGRDYRAMIASLDFDGRHVTVIDTAIPERIGYRDAYTRRLAITEANPVSIRRTARAAIDGIIAAYMRATDEAPLLQGAA